MSLPLFPQKIVHRRDEDTGLVCRPGTYSNLEKPLPKPPVGSAWLFNNHTREWKCVKVALLSEQDNSLVSDETILDVAYLEDGDINEEGAAGGTLPSGANSNTTDTVAAVPIATIQDDSYKPKSVKKIIRQVDPTKFHRHEVKETDTFQGLCLRYKVTATALRRANHFSGSDLRLAPSVLVIPVDPTAIINDQVESTETVDAEAKIRAVIRGVAASHSTAKISENEAKAYLEMNDWNVDQAIVNAREDLDFEAEEKGSR